MNTSLIATAAVALFLIIFFFIGFRRGFLRFVLSTLALVVTILLTNALIDPVSDYVENKTVIGPRLEGNIEDYVNTQVQGVTGSTTSIQNSFIDSLPLTSDMKTELKAGNTLSGYVDQGASDFAEYLAGNLTTLIIRVLCYILLFILIYLVLKLIVRCSNVVNHIPLIGGINRFAGGILGLAEGALFLWLICIGIMMLSGTEFGLSCQQVIEESKFLSYIYENNPLLGFVNSIAGGSLTM